MKSMFAGNSLNVDGLGFGRGMLCGTLMGTYRTVGFPLAAHIIEPSCSGTSWRINSSSCGDKWLLSMKTGCDPCIPQKRVGCKAGAGARPGLIPGVIAAGGAGNGAIAAPGAPMGAMHSGGIAKPGPPSMAAGWLVCGPARQRRSPVAAGCPLF